MGAGTPQLPPVCSCGRAAVPIGCLTASYTQYFNAILPLAGTLAGVTSRLERLQHLGVEVSWLMPIHPIGALHREGTLSSSYAVRDDRAINGDYAIDADLHALIGAARKRGRRRRGRT